MTSSQVAKCWKQQKGGPLKGKREDELYVSSLKTTPAPAAAQLYRRNVKKRSFAKVHLKNRVAGLRKLVLLTNGTRKTNVWRISRRYIDIYTYIIERIANFMRRSTKQPKEAEFAKTLKLNSLHKSQSNNGRGRCIRIAGVFNKVTDNHSWSYFRLWLYYVVTCVKQVSSLKNFR